MPEKKVILLIEDEYDIREIYVKILKDAGYEVLEAENGESGLSIALNSEWNLMLLDIMLPKGDGISVLKKVKAEKKLKSRPIVLITNLDSEYLITQCFELGADGYLIKVETSPGDLLNEVKGYLVS